MKIPLFWRLIEGAKEKGEGWQNMLQPLIDKLACYEIGEIMYWKQIFNEYQILSYKNKLWAAAHIINGSCSDEGFDYFRAWLIAQGKAVFTSALANPDSLADVATCEANVKFEALPGAPVEAYFKRTNYKRVYDTFNKDLAKFPLPLRIKLKMQADTRYAKDINVEWDEEDDLSALLPKLCAKFNRGK
jgi:hypothetical protein